MPICLRRFGFLFLVTRHQKLQYKRRKIEKLISINTLELEVARGRTDALDKGNEFIDVTHPFSHDIDLFGDHSFFQYLNRTATNAGKKALAAILTSNSIQQIEKRQQALQNLSTLPEWRQEFSAVASLKKEEVPIDNIIKWILNYNPYLSKVIRIIPMIFSLISLILLVLFFFEVVSSTIILLWFFTGLGIIGTQVKKINALYHQAGKAKDTFDQYAKLVAQIETTEFTSVLLTTEKSKLTSQQKKASVALKKFAKILDAFDQRNNMLYGIFGNGFLLWDLIQSYRVEQWIQIHKHKVDRWFEVIAFFDAYNSLGNFVFNHPNYSFPVLTSGEKIIEAKQLGHPMLTSKKRIDNDITISKEEFFIITGANMAGKSTFLRTVALQIVMANSGLPVCATSCNYQPIKLITSMRTSDSLSDDTSYFFSELTQLKKIVEILEKDSYFIILDEILKGTNSKDKAAGSQKFVERLVSAKATGIIATHDLSLCEIATRIPQVKNKFFDAQIINDELFFDYTFKEGICQNMNASFLLRKMGIV